MNKYKYSEDELLEHLKNISDGMYLSANDIREADGPGVTTYQNRFGTMNAAKQKADLKTYPAGKPDNGIRGKPYYRYIKEIASCVICGEDDGAVIEFHHPSDNKELNVSHVAGNNHGSQTVYDELTKTIPVCANCHAKHHSSLSNLQIDDDISYDYPTPKEVASNIYD